MEAQLDDDGNLPPQRVMTPRAFGTPRPALVDLAQSSATLMAASSQTNHFNSEAASAWGGHNATEWSHNLDVNRPSPSSTITAQRSSVSSDVSRLIPVHSVRAVDLGISWNPRESNRQALTPAGHSEEQESPHSAPLQPGFTSVIPANRSRNSGREGRKQQQEHDGRKDSSRKKSKRKFCLIQ